MSRKALILLEEKKDELDTDRLEPKDIIKTAWPCYIPAAVVGSISVFCLIGASSTNLRRNAALATAYTLSESTLKEYQEKVVETIGEKKEQSIRDSVSKDKMVKNPVREVILTESGGNTICYDVLSGRYFKSDREKFIGQIMTSKSPVRSAEDIDETALSYAEIKALCAGNPHIKEKMDLDIDVSRLKLLKANHLSQRYALEDQIIKEFPQKIKSLEQRIDGYKADMAQLAQNTLPNEDGFSSMIMAGGTVTDKKAAGEAIIGLCKSMTNPDPIHIGEYRGFDMELFFDSFSREYKITLKHELRHTVTLGTDIFGNIQRLDNALNSFQEKLTACEAQLENTKVQLENAKLEVQKPFPQEDELKTKTARLNELNAMLNLDKRENEIVDGERAEEEPSRSSDDRER